MFLRPIHIIPSDTHIDFVAKRWWAFSVTIALVIVTIVALFVKGLNFGIDFKGGILVEAKAPQAVDTAALRGDLSTLNLGEIELQQFGSPDDVLIRIQRQAGDEAAQMKAVQAVREKLGSSYEYRRVEVVGPTVGTELLHAGIIATLLAICAISIYVGVRFEWQFAVGAIIGTMHDLLLTVGFFSVTQLEFNQTSIAAILTIVGYSLNETVVVLDRIREVMRKYKRLSTAEIVDMSVNAVLPRTIMTATTVFLALLALFFLGGHVIRSFSAAMIWGIFVATYSSIFICSPMLIYLGVRADAFDKGADAADVDPAPAKGTV